MWTITTLRKLCSKILKYPFHRKIKLKSIIFFPNFSFFYKILIFFKFFLLVEVVGKIDVDWDVVIEDSFEG